MYSTLDFFKIGATYTAMGIDGVEIVHKYMILGSSNSGGLYVLIIDGDPLSYPVGEVKHINNNLFIWTRAKQDE